MEIILSVLLLINAVFNLVVWPPFFFRVRKDERAFDAQGNPTRFYTVHLVLIMAAIAIAAASLVGALAAFVS